MHRPGRTLLWILLGMCVAGLLAACGGTKRAIPIALGDPFAYDRHAPLRVRTTTVPTAQVSALLGVSLD